MAKGVAPYFVHTAMKNVSRKNEDRFFNETGILVKDIRFNVERLNLAEDDEWKALQEEIKEERTKPTH